MGRTIEVAGWDGHGHHYEIFVRPKVSNWAKASLPLYERAWCFQERILSPRILHFEYNELTWECRRITARESAPPPMAREDRKVNGLGKQPDPHCMNNIWRENLRDYVELDITYEFDRLLALSGLAKYAQQTYNRGRYLAGLWEDSLLEDLMWWVREEDAQKTRRPKEWRAPTWSWASLEGPVQHRVLPIKEAHCTVVGAQVVAAGIIRPGSDPDSYTPDEWRFGIDIQDMVEVKPHKMYVDHELESDNVSHLLDGHQVFCFCIATDQWHKCWLVLTRVSGKPEYERIGTAWQSHSQMNERRDWAALASVDALITII